MIRLGWITLFTLLLSASQSLAEVGVTKNQILIGTTMGFSGQNASRANALASGYTLYFQRVNAQGGVHGRKIRLISYDDRYKPPLTIENVRRLIQRDKVFALFKLYGTPTLKAVLPDIVNSGVPLIGPSTGGEFLRSPPLPNVYVTKPGHFEEAECGVRLAVEQLGAKKLAAFYQADAFGDSGRNGMRKSLASHGLELAGSGSYSQAYSQRNSDEIKVAVDKIIKNHPDAVFLWSIGGPALQFMDEAAKRDFHPIYIAQLALISPEFLEGVKARGERVYVAMAMPMVEDRSLPVTQEYVEAASAARQRITTGGLEGYIDAMLLVEALNRAGPDLTRESFKRALETKMTDLKMKGLEIRMSPRDHQAFSTVYLGQVLDGRLTPLKSPGSGAPQTCSVSLE